MFTIQAHIHAPLLHRLIIDDVWSPLVALHIRTFELPAMGIEVAELHGLTLVVLYFGDDVRLISIGIIHQGTLLIGKETVHIACSFLARLEGSPLLIIAGSSGLAPAKMRTIYIIGRRARVGDVVHHDGWVVASDTLVISSRLVSIRQVIVCYLSLSRSSHGGKTYHGE